MQQKQAQNQQFHTHARTNATIHAVLLQRIQRMPLSVAVHVDLDHVLAFLPTCANGYVANAHVAQLKKRHVIGAIYTGIRSKYCVHSISTISVLFDDLGVRFGAAVLVNMTYVCQNIRAGTRPGRPRLVTVCWF